MNAFIEELKWRGLWADMTPGTEDQLNKEMTTAYIGFDQQQIRYTLGALFRLRFWLIFNVTATNQLLW